MAKLGGYRAGDNGEVNFSLMNNDSRLIDQGDVGMGLPEFNDYRGATGGDQGGPLYNDYRQTSLNTGDVMSVMWDRPIGGGGGGQGGRHAKRGMSRRAR